MTAELKGLAGIAGTAFGAVTGPAAIALTRRADRKHEANLDFEKRARQDKQQALIRIFGTVSEMRRACEPESSWKPQGVSEEIQFAFMRAVALLVYHKTRADFVPVELLAYGSKAVCSRIEKLDAMLKAHYTAATTVSLNERERYTQQPNDAVGEGGANEALQLLHQRQNIEDNLGTDSGLDIDELRPLCDQVLEAAKKICAASGAAPP
jgi:hypothetical protein